MGEYMLKVPAEHVETFRTNVYGRFAGEGDTLDKMAGTLAYPGGESWSKFIGNEDADPQDVADNIERYAVQVLKATRDVAALVQVMEQLGWTDPIEGDVELVADPKVLGRIIEDCLVDAGGAVHDVTDTRPFDRTAFDAATARGAWLADRRAEVEAVGA